MWKWFEGLNDQRPPSDSGLTPFSFQEIEAFSRLYGLSIKPWEVDVLLDMDTAWRVTVYNKSKSPTNQRPATAENMKSMSKGLLALKRATTKGKKTDG